MPGWMQPLKAADRCGGRALLRRERVEPGLGGGQIAGQIGEGDVVLDEAAVDPLRHRRVRRFRSDPVAQLLIVVLDDRCERGRLQRGRADRRSGSRRGGRSGSDLDSADLGLQFGDDAIEGDVVHALLAGPGAIGLLALGAGVNLRMPRQTGAVAFGAASGRGVNDNAVFVGLGRVLGVVLEDFAGSDQRGCDCGEKVTDVVHDFDGMMLQSESGRSHNSTVTVTFVNMLRAYQQKIVTGVKQAWADGLKNVIPMMATGAGKTRVMAHIARESYDKGEAGVAMAHRSVLIAQLSMALAEAGVPHDLIASKKVIKAIVKKHMRAFGRSFFNPSSRWKVASVDTMPGRAAALTSWINQVVLGFTDESHHVLRDNKWGRECNRFQHKDMRWLLPTATPERADGQGLGRVAAGIADIIVHGPRMRWCIDNGYLTDYYLRAPIPSDLDLSDVPVGPNGEYNIVKLRKAIHRSGKIVGNIVDTYKEHTPGLLGIVFAVDIEHARAITKEFNDKGVPAELITGDDDEDARNDALERYANRQTLILVNVDLFGEGFDLPAIEVVIMARPTASYPLYEQQWGRGARLGVAKTYLDDWESYTVEQRLAIIAASPKPRYYVHDHVGNVLHFFGPPDKPREFSLGGGTKSNRSADAIPLRSCLTCFFPMERFLTRCPRCNAVVPPPPAPTLPEQVDGDIALYTSEMLWKLFGVDTVEKALALKPNEFCAVPHGRPELAKPLMAKHNAKILEQQRLARLMPLVMPPKYTDRENNRRFFHLFGMDVVQAKLLGGADTQALNEKIEERLTNR